MTDSTRPDIVVHVFGRTDVGRTREHNEDSFVVADLTSDIASLQPAVRQHKGGAKGTLFMVADGMGGAAAGEIASQMATDIVLREMRENWRAIAEPSSDDFARCLKKAAQAANAQIHGYATSHQEYRGMGTTATIAGFLDDTLYLAQVGDSRGYLVRDGVPRQITKDQSLMQKLIEAGELTEEEAAQSERRNIILQALGPEANIKVDLTHQKVRRGDILVLCSDGLSGQVTKDQIAQVVNSEKDLVAACKKLIDKANEAGGPDNITVIIARFDGEGLAAVAEEDEVGHRVFALSDGTPATPNMAMDRIGEGPTAPMGGRQTKPVDQQPAIAAVGAIDAFSSTPTDLPAIADDPPPPRGDDPAEVSTLDSIDVSSTDELQPAGRSRNLIIALVVLALLGAGAFFAMKMMKRPQPEATPPAPAATP